MVRAQSMLRAPVRRIGRAARRGALLRLHWELVLALPAHSPVATSATVP